VGCHSIFRHGSLPNVVLCYTRRGGETAPERSFVPQDLDEESEEAYYFTCSARPCARTLLRTRARGYVEQATYRRGSSFPHLLTV